MSIRKFALLSVCLVVCAQAASAACMNKFVARSEGTRQVVTLLTGKLTFQEAQDLSQLITHGQAPAFEWVDDKGKTLAKQFGELKVVRPMPVGCDGKASGVVVIVTFGSAAPPSKKLNVRMDGKTIVEFEQQSN